MAFTYFAELFLNSTWTDITSDVRADTGFDITRGRADEASAVSPGVCRFTLKNTAGKYSPRNPAGTYYGQLGRNTPFRLRTQVASDGFGRVTANGWGTADSGQGWGTSGTAGDFSTDATYGKQAISGLNTYRVNYLTQPADLVQTATVRISVQTLTQAMSAGFFSRWDSANGNWYAGKLFFNPTPFGITAEISRVTANATTALVSVATGITYSANHDYGIRFETCGSLLKLKVWDASGAEPVAWTLETTDSTYTAAGKAGPFSIGTTGNTNVLPVTFSYDSYVSTEVRFAGEMSTWPQRWDPTGRNVTAQVEASGILRRLNKQPDDVKSQLRRYLEATPHTAYWPMEDSSAAGSFASADSNGIPMAYGSAVTPAASAALNGTQPVAKTETGGALSGAIGSVLAVTTSWTVGALVYIPTAPGIDTELFRWGTAGSPSMWTVTLLASGAGIKLRGLDSTGTIIAAFDTLAFSYTDTTGTISQFGKWVYLVIGATQSGANISYYMNLCYAAGGLAGGTGLAAGTAGGVSDITSGPIQSGLTGTFVGHMIITNDTGSRLSVDMSAYLGTVGERAGARLVRLAAEAGIPMQLVGVSANTVLMGAQRAAPLATLLQDCADADHGILCEQRGALGLRYVTSASLGNQTAMALNYHGDLSGSLEPTDDDQLVKNDVTATRVGGSSYRYIVTSGTLSTAAPPNGVGPYDGSFSAYVQSDSQLADQASWVAHVGTVDAVRIPAIGVNLARSVYTASESKSRTAKVLDIGDWLSVTSPPVWLDSNTIEQVVQGTREQYSRFEQIISWNTTPASPYKIFTLEDASFGRLCAGTTITLSAGVAAGATSIVAVTAATGVPFTNAAGDLPFDILVAGERMTVTAVGSASSPQTLTVTRAVNSVSKAQTAGAVIEIWDVTYLALA